MALLKRIRAVLDGYRDRVVDSTTGLFAHAPYPLANTLTYRGDPGLCGPDSVTWPVIGDAAAFIGGIRALLVQAAHPEVAAGVSDHSRYRQDPLGRLSRTSAYVTATSFGAMPEVEAAIEIVKGAHRPVRGSSHRGKSYSASAPGMAAWVHNTLTDSFLVAFQTYGSDRLSSADADRFVAEQTGIGRLMAAKPLPDTAGELAAWIEGHPALGKSPGLVESIGFLKKPPLPLHIRIPYKVLYAAAVATVPATMRNTLGIHRLPGAITAGRIAVKGLRWALGSSPTWHVALVRSGAPIPPGLFRRQIPGIEAFTDQ